MIEEVALTCRNQRVSPSNMKPKSSSAFGAVFPKEKVGLFLLTLEN